MNPGKSVRDKIYFGLASIPIAKICRTYNVQYTQHPIDNIKWQIKEIMINNESR